MAPPDRSPQRAAVNIPEQLDLGPIFVVLKERSVFLALSTLICASLLFASSFLIPRRYKSEAQITIYTRYFQNPLVSELIPDQYDSSELRLQRESLLHQAIDDSFIDRIGEKEHVFKSAPGTAGRFLEKDLLRRDFEIFGINGTTFQINSIAGDPLLAQRNGKAALEQIVQMLVTQRRKTLANARDAIRARLESIAFQTGKTFDPVASNRPEVLKHELHKLQQETEALLRHFTPRHEEVQRRMSRMNWIKAYLADHQETTLEKGDSNSAADSKTSLLGSENENPSKEVYQELLKKLNYLNVAMEMEKTDLVNYFGVLEEPNIPIGAFSPKRFKFLGFGIMAGILLGLFAILMQEYLKSLSPTAEKRAEAWGVPLLGTLPIVRWPAVSQRSSSIKVPSSEKPNASEWN